MELDYPKLFMSHIMCSKKPKECHIIMWEGQTYFVTLLLSLEVELLQRKNESFLVEFLAVQNSSIGDLVTHSLTHSLTDSVTHSTFTFDIKRATLETCDL